MVRKILPMLLVLLVLPLAACGDYGDVRQGRVVKYDTSQSPPVAWFVSDRWTYSGNPEQDLKSIYAFHIPENQREMGRIPEVGEMAYLNVDERYIVLFDDSTMEFTRIGIEVLAHDENVHVREQHHRVWDPTLGRRGGAKTFPIIDEQASTIEIFFQRMNTWTKIKVNEDILNMYNDPKYWRSGDEIRVYYRQGPQGSGTLQRAGRALRLMNVTHTDINARG